MSTDGDTSVAVRPSHAVVTVPQKTIHASTVVSILGFDWVWQVSASFRKRCLADVDTVADGTGKTEATVKVDTDGVLEVWQ